MCEPTPPRYARAAGAITASLRRHPDSPADGLERLEVALRLTAAGDLDLKFTAQGPTANLRVPPPGPPARADGLWRTTCFELFVRRPQDEQCKETPYWEFNFSPSGSWAAYRFDRYREGMREEAAIDALAIACESRAKSLSLAATAPLATLASLAGATSIELGLSAVIERADGLRSFWALAHREGPPDFHDPDAFACRLAYAGAARGLRPGE